MRSTKRVAPQLDPAGSADCERFGGGAQQAGVIDEVDPRADRTEVGEDIPNRLRLRRYGAAAANLGHLNTIGAQGRWWPEYPSQGL